jgi:hypothetical protein
MVKNSLESLITIFEWRPVPSLVITGGYLKQTVVPVEALTSSEDICQEGHLLLFGLWF